MFLLNEKEGSGFLGSRDWVVVQMGFENLLMDDVRDRTLAQPGSPAKVDYEYERNGSVNVFCVVESKQGVYFNKPTERLTGSDFAELMKDIEKHDSKAKKIVLVKDLFQRAIRHHLNILF